MTSLYSRKVCYFNGPLHDRVEELSAEEVVKERHIPLAPKLRGIEEPTEPIKLKIAVYERFTLSDGVIRYWYMGERDL